MKGPRSRRRERLLELDEVERRLKPFGRRYVGVREIPLDALVGRRGAVVTGTAAAGSPARARITDHHGQHHYVMVEPNAPEALLSEGDTILLVRRTGELFHAIDPDAPPIR